jgi:cytosine/adenosine deaminase-related metal-dependent hydrolase
MKDIVVKGAIFKEGEMKNGLYSILKEKFIDSPSNADVEGTLIKAPINFHTHVGDSFIGSEPDGDLEHIVGPGGFKMRELNAASPALIRRSMRKSIELMKNRGTAAFFDFRESGMKGLKMVPKFGGISGFFLTRPTSNLEVELLLNASVGFGMSALSDHEFKDLKRLSETAHKKNKIFSIHFSENKRENVRDLMVLSPDFVVHCIEATDGDLDVLRRSSVPVAITPRSNIFHGKRPDYSRFFRKNLTVLLGTDNVFITEPEIMEEAEFLYRYQRKLNRLSPEQILTTITDNPRKVISSLGLRFKDEKYLLFPNENLTPYQIVTRPNYYDRFQVTRNRNGISLLAFNKKGLKMGGR